MTELMRPAVNNLSGPKATIGEDRKIFVGGLSWDTTEDDLIQYFSQYGDITNVNIKYNALTGNPRGFGFITFACDGSIDAVLESGPHSIKDKVIDPRKAKTRSNCKKIFVGGLDSNLTEDQIRNYFGRFGSIECVELPFDRSRGRRREFCFIIFDSEESAEAACVEAKQVIGGRDCDIKKAQPRVQNSSRQQRTTNGYHHQMTNDLYNTGYGWRDEYNNGMMTSSNWRSNRPSVRNGFSNGSSNRVHRDRVYTGSAFNPQLTAYSGY